MPLNPALIADTAQQLLDCACAALTASARQGAACCDPEGPTMRAFVAEGEVAWDTCCGDCGQLSVRLVHLFETDNPPNVIQGPSPCNTRRVVAEWEILRLRCAATGEPPLPDRLTGSGTALLTDLWTLWTGLGCCFAAWDTDTREDRQGWLTDAHTDGPTGACVGASITAQTVLGPACDCRPSTPDPIP